MCLEKINMHCLEVSTYKNRAVQIHPANWYTAGTLTLGVQALKACNFLEK